MKNLIVFLSIVCSACVYAQEFKPYKVKSGKIVYERMSYLTRSVIKFENGVETGSSEQIPYVAEQIIYYWDEFGDIAFEETYKVSKFGGKPLPEKVKITEQLWVDEHLYYFIFDLNKVEDDSYGLRIKCREYFQYYQIKDSWIETLYMGTEKSGAKEILGKEADLYKVSNSYDIHVWKGLELKNESFITTVKGERLYPHRTKIAVEIDTVSLVNKELFNPIWLKREKLYNSLDENKIVELIDAQQEVLEQADNIKGIELQRNDILLFVTSKLTVGKMQVLTIDEDNQLIIKYGLYSKSNSITDWRESFIIENNAAVNIDSPNVKEIAPKELDFKWSATNKATLFPQNNISVFLLKPSR